MAENIELAEESAVMDEESSGIVSENVVHQEDFEAQELESEPESAEADDAVEASGQEIEEEGGESPEEKEEEAVDTELLQILTAQSDVLDCMLTQQKKIHDSVRDRRWSDLEESLSNMRAYSDAFVNLDQCRENYVGDDRTVYLAPAVQEVYVNVRTKLSRSRIENTALATYVSSTKEFVDGIIENCIPQSRAKVYGRNGRIMSPTAESVVLDALV
ncbi:MAG: hypothetical protein II563_05245 [Treponema sp.]|nr:hypothetical protein [Treponema sp.]MBQ4235930.1 hypothetical protein [Treponema sp.]